VKSGDKAEGSAIQAQQGDWQWRGMCRPYLACPLALVEAIRSGEHLFGGASREGQKENALRWTPCSIRCATRQARVQVLPVPAPAITRMGRRQRDGLELFRVEGCLPLAGEPEHVFEYTTALTRTTCEWGRLLCAGTDSSTDRDLDSNPDRVAVQLLWPAMLGWAVIAAVLWDLVRRLVI